MKKYLLAVLTVLLLAGCKSTPKFTDVSGKEWKLTDVRLNDKSINFDRNTLDSEGYGEIFTLVFDNGQLSGIGAPNRFSASFTLGKNQAIEVKQLSETTMEPLRQPEKLKEKDYFAYIQNAYEWTLLSNNLELSAKSEASDEVVLVFSL